MSLQDSKNEAASIYSLSGNDMLKSIEMLERQLNVLHTRAQVLMTLSGVIVTVTGFSGRIIAGTSLLAKISIICGLLVVLCSAIWTWNKVMSIKWITADIEGDPVDCLSRIIERRSAKTKAYKFGGIILCVGFLIYSIAIAQMLLFTN